jgi:hypothetical protein
MDVEVVDDRPVDDRPATGPPRGRSVPVPPVSVRVAPAPIPRSKPKPETATEPTVVDGSVIYEQDVRAAAHRNGRAPHLLGAEVGGGPPAPPGEEPSGGGLPNGAGGNRILAYGLAVTYLGAGALALWVGLTMLRDLRKKKE